MPVRELYKLAIGLFAVLALALASIYWWDQSLSAYFGEKSVHEFWFGYFRPITTAGQGEFHFGFALGCIVIGWWANKKPSWFRHQQMATPNSESPRPLTEALGELGRRMLSALVIAGLFVQLLKFVIGRARPSVSPDFHPWVWDPFNHHWNFHSMPSGHSQTAFTTATILALYFPRFRYWFFLAAASIALSRVVLNAHSLSDVIVGSYIGIAVAYLVVKLWPARSQGAAEIREQKSK